MWQKRFKSSFSDSVKALEADIQHANSITAALPRDNCGDRIQMRLSYSPFAQVFLFLMDWMDYSCTDAIPTHLGLLNVLVNRVCLDGMPRMSSKEAKASLREFYAVIYPLLKQLKGEFARIGGINRATPEGIEGKGSSAIENWREMTNAGYAWKVMRIQYCLIAGIPCALAATITGMHGLVLALFAEAA